MATPWTPTVVSVAVALAACAPLYTQTVPNWRTDFDAARIEAARDHKPLLLCFHSGDDPKLAAKIARLYRDQKLCASMHDFVVVLASTGTDPDQARELFGSDDCEAHGRVDRQVRRSLFGPIHDLRGPQHLILTPSGAVVWHEFDQTSASSLCRAIQDAARTMQESRGEQDQAFIKSFRRLTARAGRDHETDVMLRVAFANAPASAFPAAIERLGIELARELLNHAGNVAPHRTLERLAALGDQYPKRLEGVIVEASRRISAQVPDLGTTAPLDQRESVEAMIARRLPPLEMLGDAQAIPDVAFSGSEVPTLTGKSPHARLLLFFLPNDASLPAQRDVWNRVAADFSAGSIESIGLGATLHPTEDLVLTDAAGFAFPAANYRYDQRSAPYGITEFPRAVLLDAEGHVRFQGDAYRLFERAVSQLRREIETVTR